VLPRSPFPDRSLSRVAARSSIPGRRASGRGLGPWRLPLFAALATVAALVLTFLALWPQISRPAPTDDAAARLSAGRRFLEEGSFHRALAELEAAAAECKRRPDALPPDELRRLDRLRRQAHLLDALLDEPLQDLLGEAAAVRRENEWQIHFERHYKGRAVVFDDEVGLDALGRPQLRTYVVESGEERARVALEDLIALRQAPLSPPQRLVFGGRLGRFGRDEGGGWVIGFDPDSGVLFTDPEVLAAWRPSLLDADLREVLRRQEGWLRGT
jgi:hypothetical protein